MRDQAIVFATLGLSLVAFFVGRWRYDVVGLAALLVVTIAGVVPSNEAFSGFGHPAVITVAAVLALSRGLERAGVVDILSRLVARAGDHRTAQVLAVTGVVALVSGFINNVGAVALFMPVALRLASRTGQSPARLLMPLAFGSLLGGMMTLIGTPPNIIVSGFRRDALGEPFRMFEFAPVGLTVTAVGVMFVAALGWRLVPQRRAKASLDELFEFTAYLTELRVPEDAELVGRPLGSLTEGVEGDVIVVALVRGEERIVQPSLFELLRSGDVVVTEASPEAIGALVDATGLELVGRGEDRDEPLGAQELLLMEAVVTPGAMVAGRSAAILNLRWRHGINLLAVARGGRRIEDRLSHVRFRPGDVLLLQGPEDAVHEAIGTLGCLPLANRDLRLGAPRRTLAAVTVFAAAVALTATGILDAEVAFVLGVGVMVVTGLLDLADAYDAVDWPVIVLLGAMIPVGEALEASGGAQRVADGVLAVPSSYPTWVVLSVVMVTTMALSNVVNNAAAAVIMAPIGMAVSEGLGSSPDPFLMAVAVGASAAFLTPIGHQSNTLVLGAGGYRFGDFWRLGLPVSVLVVAAGVPMVLAVWPAG